MPGTQELTRRIKSVKSTRKVTRAMQMVSASKMRKAQVQAIGSRTYADLAMELISTLSLRGPAKQSNDEVTDGQGLPRRGLLHRRQGHGGQVAMTDNLFQTNEDASKIAVLIISANKGLVGSFNVNVLAKLREIEREHVDKKIELITIGKKVSEAAARLSKNIIAEFPKSDGGESVEGVYPLSSYVSQMYKTGEYGRVYVVYNHFVSTLTQKATVKQLLPFVLGPTSPNPRPNAAGGQVSLERRGINAGSGSSSAEVSSGSSPHEERQGEVLGASEDTIQVSKASSHSSPSKILPSEARTNSSLREPEGSSEPRTASRRGEQMPEYLYEPTREKVIEQLVPRIIESQLYQALLESDASEHSARMIMMQNATESAGDLIADLTLTFNQLRQNKITTELAEITAGRISLEG